jgi:small-conductance mechanosensitive channel
MPDFPVLFLTTEIIQNIAVSVALIVIALLGRAVAIRSLEASSWQNDEMGLRWRARIRNLTILIILFALMVVWATEIRTLALSAVAIAAAIVLATKELIMCFGGGILRTATESFTVGDRIEVRGHRGDVVHYGFMTTTILEIGPNHQRTGRAIIMPNSALLTDAVTNESFTEDYVLHTFAVPAPRDQWQTHENHLLNAARDVCEPYLDNAREHMDATSRRLGLPVMNTEPRVTLQLPDADKLTLMVRVPVPSVEKGRVEQEIVRLYLEDTT